MILSVAVVLGAGCLSLDEQGPNGNGIPIDTVTFRAVDAGGSHSCGIVEGDFSYCWGNNSVGQLGNGGGLSHAVPVAVSQGPLAFQQISAGGSLSCAVTADGDAYCWGQNQFGQIGSGVISSPVTAPEEVLGGRSFSVVSAGGVHACGLVANGEAWCWGLPASGQLGNGVSGETPVPVPDSVRGGHVFEEISAGTDHTCGVLSGSTDAYCWGQNTNGELGDGTTLNKDVPTLVVGGLLLKTIDAGDGHTCAVDLDGAAYCWGIGADGQLGTGSRTPSAVPVAVTGGFFFESISAGSRYTCGVAAGGEAYCWGLNSRGELGDGTSISRDEPVLVEGNLVFETISAGEGGLTAATCGFTSDNLVYCWGEGLEGQLGNGSTSSSPQPVLVVGQR
jgi:alpha-tubulin suppressor-like RCC1 family protein